MIKLIILLLIILAKYSLCLNTSSPLYIEVFTYHNETYEKAEFAYQVVNKIFNAFKQWYFTITFCEFTYFENRILKYTENYGYGYPVMLLNGCQDRNATKVKPKIATHGYTAYLVTSDNLSVEGSENAIQALKKTGVFQPRSAVIFVINVPVVVDRYFHYDMKIHFELLSSKRITNSIIVIWSDRLRMYSYNPFSKDIIDVTDVKDITDLLSSQYEDLYGHELRLSVFRKIYISDETGPVHCNSKLAMTVMKELNASCNPLAPRDGNTVGDLLENGTATGVTADLLDGFTDLELNSRILKNSYYGYIDTTYPLIQDELCFLIRKSMKQSTFTTTVNLISVDMLLSFAVVVIIFIVISIVIRKVERKVWLIDDRRSTSETVMDLIKCFIRQTVDMKFTGPVFRCVVLLIMMYSLVVDCAIDGIITSAIAYPRFKADLNTFPELLDANLTFAVHNRHIRIFNRSLSGDYAEKILKNTEIFNDRLIKEAIEKRKYQYAILLRKSDAQYISRKPSNMENGRPLYHTAGDCPVPCSIVYGLRYGSPYLPKLNDLLKHLNQGGILEHWTQSDEYTLFQKHNKMLYADDNKEKKPLSIETVKEILIVWSFGLFLSTLTFVAELMMFALNKIPTI